MSWFCGREASVKACEGHIHFTVEVGSATELLPRRRWCPEPRLETREVSVIIQWVESGRRCLPCHVGSLDDPSVGRVGPVDTGSEVTALGAVHPPIHVVHE